MDIFWYLLIIFSSITGLLVLISFLGYKWLKRKDYPKIAIAIPAIIMGAFFYSIYTAFYPTDNFYFEEFKEVTLRQVPESAIVIRKSASYPDMHGDYCSASLIRLSRQDFIILFDELSQDKRLVKNGELISSSEFEEVIGNSKPENIKFSFIRQITEKEDLYLYIGFMDDQETIVVSVCQT